MSDETFHNTLKEDVRKLLRNQISYNLSIRDEAERVAEVLGRLSYPLVLECSASERQRLITEAIHGVEPLDYPNNP